MAIDCQHLCRLPFWVKRREDTGTTGICQTPGEHGVTEHAHQRGGQGLGLLSRHQQSINAILDNLGYPAGADRNHRSTARHRLDQRQSERFLHCRVRQDVQRGIKAGHLVLGYETGKGDGVMQAQRGNTPNKILLVVTLTIRCRAGARACKHEAHPWYGMSHGHQRIE